MKQCANPMRCSVLGLMLCFAAVGFAQPKEWWFKHLKREQGLSQSAVYDILQGPRGYYWIATQDGLNRFDGSNFRIYQHKAEDPHSLSGNNTRRLLPGPDGKLWVGTTKGLNLFDPDTGVSQVFRHQPDQADSLSHDRIISLFQDGPNRMIIGTYRGVCVMDLRDMSITRIDDDLLRRHRSEGKMDLPFRLYAVMRDRAGNLWLGFNGLLLMGSDFDQLQVIDDIDPGKNIFTAFYQDNAGGLWIGASKDGLYYKSSPTSAAEQVVARADDDLRITGMAEGKPGQLFVTSNNGMYLVDAAKREMRQHWQHDPTNSTTLSINTLWSLYRDPGGVLWISTLGGGVNYVNPEQLKFGRYGVSSGISAKIIWCLAEDNSGDAWIGTSSGVNWWRKDRGVIEVFTQDPEVTDPTKTLLGNDINSIAVDQDNRVWVATTKGVSLLDTDRKSWRSFPIRAVNGPRSGNIMDIFVTRDNRVFIATLGSGLEQYKPEQDRWVGFTIDKERADAFHTNRFTSIFEDSKGSLWLTTIDSGLEVLHADGTISHYPHRKDQVNTPLDNDTSAVYEDKQGYYWIGTNGSGLSRLDAQTGTFVHYRESNGLPSGQIAAILGDDDGNIWISTYNGIARLEPYSGSILVFDIQDGLQAREFNTFVGARGKDLLYFGGIQGINAFNPKDIVIKRTSPKVLITELMLRNTLTELKRYDSESPIARYPHTGDPVFLTYEDYQFSFKLAAPSAMKDRDLVIAYKLEGYDPDWISADAATPIATYTKPGAGSYIFKARAGLGDGSWSEEFRLPLHIQPPWWKTNVAYGLYVLMAVGLLVLFYRWRLARARRDAEMQLILESERMAVEANRAKTTFLSNMSHELRTPLNAIIGFSELHLEEPDLMEKDEVLADLGKIHHAARHQLNLVNNVLDIAKIEAGKVDIHPEDVALDALVEEISLSMEPLIMRNQNRFEVENITAGEMIHVDLLKLKQALFNLISNAAKFTEKGLIRLKIFRAPFEDREHIFFEVNDNGIGMTREEQERLFHEFYQAETHRKAEGSGLGLVISRQFCRLMQGDITVSSTVGEGSTFTITLPVRVQATNA